MTTRSMAYDHPIYTVNQVYSGSTTVGANGVTTKWCAFTSLKLKATVLGINIASTAAGSQPLLFKKSGTATTTTTLTVLTSAAVTPIRNEIDVDLIQGDQFWVTHGTDATASLGVAVEAEVTPGAVVTI